ncbi:MAG: hypothetical protein K6E68_02885 [Lachnospiraceae bacterium]|nr:hypothetical protein [Lachnospiraceae bacterium]
MRITTKVIQSNSINNINTNKVLQDKLNNQMATEKKIVRPSDDPVVAIRALRLRTNVSQVTQYYEKNAPDAESWMKVTEDSLTTVSSVITDMIEQCTKGASEKLTATDRTTILNELKALRDEVYATGNADYAGRSVFTGYRTETTLKYTEAESRKYSINEQLKNDALDTITYVNSAYLNGINQVNYNNGAYFDPSGKLKKNSDMVETGISESTIHRIRLAYENIDAEDIDFRIYKGDKYDAAASTAALENELNYGRKIYDAAGNVIVSGSHGLTITQAAEFTAQTVPDSATFEAMNAASPGLLVEKEGYPGEYEDATEYDATKTYYKRTKDAQIGTYNNRSVGNNGDFYTENGTKFASTGDMAKALDGGEKIYDAAGNVISETNGAYTYANHQPAQYTTPATVATEAAFTSGGTWYVQVDGKYVQTDVYDPTIEYCHMTQPEQPGSVTLNASKASDYYIRTRAEDLPVSERYQTMSFLNIEVVSQNNIPNPYQKMAEYDEANAEAVKNGDPATDRAILIPETGELLISSSAYEKIMKLKDDVTSPTYDEGQFQIEYKKTTWKKDDLKPEHYFACTDMSDPNPINHIRYNTDYLSGIVEKQSIEYDVGLNQTIRVNTTADEVFTHAIGRDIDDLITSMQEVIDMTETVDRFEKIRNGLDVSDPQYTTITNQIDAANKALTFLKEKNQKLFEGGITKMQGHLNKVNEATTACGTREKKLSLIQNRLMSQKTNFETLESENENVEITDVALQLKGAELTYQAALMSTSKILQTSLMNYI